MLTDESLIEWAASWVPETSPLGEPEQRTRFAEALRHELGARANRLAIAVEALESLERIGWPSGDRGRPIVDAALAAIRADEAKGAETDG